jgi:prepilin-type N-terminal cleavage/methylation domain-containing protein
MKNTNLRSAFTLIELLVVISIIAILAGIALPAYTSVIVTGKMTHAMSDARQAGFACMLFAQDNDGAFPFDQKFNTSNDAFAELFPAYLTNEAIFAVGGSKDGPRADSKISPQSEVLKKGENHWAYIGGLSTTSNSSWPLIVDGTAGSGYYSDREGDMGGLWKGSKAIVIHTDNSAAMQKLHGTGAQRYLPRFDDWNKNALDVNDYMGDGVKLLEPAR